MKIGGLHGDFKKIHRGVEQLVAHRAHNPEVVGSNPTPATTRKGLEHLFETFLFLQHRGTALLFIAPPGLFLSGTYCLAIYAQPYYTLVFKQEFKLISFCLVKKDRC